MNNSGKKYTNDSPIPNWPKPQFLKIENFSKYCQPVNQAIIDGLKRDNKIDLLKKFLNERDLITQQELDEIIKSYSTSVDLILMRSGF